jgi:hypothetical protein
LVPLQVVAVLGLYKLSLLQPSQPNKAAWDHLDLANPLVGIAVSTSNRSTTTETKYLPPSQEKCFTRFLREFRLAEAVVYDEKKGNGTEKNKTKLVEMERKKK